MHAGQVSRAPQSPAQRIRIALVIDRVFLPAGGTERQLLHLLSGLDRGRFDPKLFVLQDTEWLRDRFSSSSYEALGVHLGRNPAMLAGIWRFARTLRRGRFDIVQTYFRDSNVVGVVAASLASVPTIISCRRGVPYWQSSLGLRFLKLLNTRVNEFLANSQATRQRLILEEGVHPSRVSVIYNGLDPARFSPSFQSDSKRLLLGELGLAEATHQLVGIVANLRLVKGIDVFLHAAKRVLRRRPNVQFVIVGAGPQRDSLMRLAHDLSVATHVHFLGSRDDVPTLLGAFDVGVLASRYESFANAILEYLAAGLPVVVTDVGGAREAVTDGVSGFIVPPDDPEAMASRLVEILGHPRGAREWRKELVFPRQFHLDSMVEAHASLYSRLASHNVAAPR